MSPDECFSRVSDDDENTSLEEGEGEEENRVVMEPPPVPRKNLPPSLTPHNSFEGSVNRTELTMSADSNVATTTVKCCIVGAGAAGLQCAHSLISEHGYDPSDIVILEARDYIGGRIHTVQTSQTNLHTGRTVQFPRDHGAAWVHGTGMDWGYDETRAQDDEDDINNDDNRSRRPFPLPNPMMELLQLETGPDECLYEEHLVPVFRQGNPWMRPGTVVHDTNSMVLYVAGRRLASNYKDSKVIQAALLRHFTVLQLVSRHGQGFFAQGRGLETVQISLARAMEGVLRDSKELPAQLRHFGEQDQNVIQALAPFYWHLVECYYGATASELQLCTFTDDDNDDETARVAKLHDKEYTLEGDFYGPHCTLRRGMQTVLQPLLRNGVRNRVRLNEAVTKIWYNSPGGGKSNCPADSSHEPSVVIETANGTQVHADCCVVTLPAGCLKEAVAVEDHSTDNDQGSSSSFFEPQLSPLKVEAIHASKMGGYKKVFLTFDRIFWPVEQAFLGMVRNCSWTAKNDGSGTASNDPLGNYLLFDNLWARNGFPCIEAVLFGSAAAHFAGRGDEEIRDAVVDFMLDAMGLTDSDDDELRNLHKLCTDCHVTRWEEDPFSRGAYSHMTLGTLERHVQELSRPEWDGRLVIAGEGTVAEFEGSVHGALFSGRKASKQMHSFLESSAASTSSRRTAPLPKAVHECSSPSTVANYGPSLLST